MAIAYDNVTVAERPVRWDMLRVLTMSTVLGVLGVIASFGLFWYAERGLQLQRPTIQTLIFLKLLVAGHLTIYLTRNVGWFWQRPWPSWRLFWACEMTQALGTLAAVYGWLVAPIGWTYALLVWGYALAWFVLNNIAKVWTYQALRRGTKAHERSFNRLHGPRPALERPSAALSSSISTQRISTQSKIKNFKGR